MPVAAMIDDVTLACDMADRARAIALRYFRQDLGLSMKGDQTPVTLADREIEAALRDILGQRRGADGVFGEEMPATGAGQARQWVIDPIDGTGAFATGSPLFGVLIGLIDGGAPMLGLIDACATGERWLARRGGGATLNGAPCRTSGQKSLGSAAISSTAIHQYSANDLKAFNRVSERAAITRLGGDCYAYGLLAAGHLDAVIETGLMPYDYLPILPVVEEAGGVMTDWTGAPLSLSSDGHVVAAASRELHSELLNRLGHS